MQPREGDLSTMNVPALQYDNTMDPLHFSKSPSRYRNGNFSPNQARVKNNNSIQQKVKSPSGRNASNNFSTINLNMNSVEMRSPMASMSKNIMMQPFNDMSKHLRFLKVKMSLHFFAKIRTVIM